MMHSVLVEHEKKIRDVRYLIAHSSGFVKADAKKYLNRLLKEKAEYLRYQKAMEEDAKKQVLV